MNELFSKADERRIEIEAQKDIFMMREQIITETDVRSQTDSSKDSELNKSKEFNYNETKEGL